MSCLLPITLHSGLCLHHYSNTALLKVLPDIHFTNPVDIFRAFFFFLFLTLPLISILYDSVSLASAMTLYHLPCHSFHSYLSASLPCSFQMLDSSGLRFTLSFLTLLSLWELRVISLWLQYCVETTDFQIFFSRYL